MKASDFFTKRYLMGFVASDGKKVYSDAFNTKRELFDFQQSDFHQSDFHQWCINHFKNLSYFVEYHDRRGFVARDFDFITARKYQILALKRARFSKTSYAIQMLFCIKHKLYFSQGIECNSLCEMREIQCI